MTPVKHRLPRVCPGVVVALIATCLMFGSIGALAPSASAAPAKCVTKKVKGKKVKKGCAVAGASGAAAATGSGTGNMQFVNMGYTSDQPDGVAVDIYIGASSPPQAGDKITALKPKPKKIVSGLAFGAATKYVAKSKEFSFLIVTVAGSPEVAALGEIPQDLTKKGATATFSVENNTSNTGPLQLLGYDEAEDYTYTDGTGLPIKGSSVLMVHGSGLTGVATANDSDEANQFFTGIVGQGCIPQFGASNRPDFETTGPGGGENAIGTEYVTAPGTLQLALYPTASVEDCSGPPVGTGTGTFAADSRYYLYWYGPITSPKLLVVPVAPPLDKKSGPAQTYVATTTTTG